MKTKYPILTEILAEQENAAYNPNVDPIFKILDDLEKLFPQYDWVFEYEWGNEELPAILARSK